MAKHDAFEQTESKMQTGSESRGAEVNFRESYAKSTDLTSSVREAAMTQAVYARKGTIEDRVSQLAASINPRDPIEKHLVDEVRAAQDFHNKYKPANA